MPHSEAVKELMWAAEEARLVIRRLAGGEISTSRRLGIVIAAVEAEEKPHKFDGLNYPHTVCGYPSCGLKEDAPIHQIGGNNGK